MKKNLSKINKFAPFLIFIFFIIIILFPHPVEAGWRECLSDSRNCDWGIMDKITAAIFDVVGVILTPIASLLLGIMSLFTMMAGVFLNTVVKFTIIDMAAHLPAESITSTWRILRDIANMSFIFVLLYTSILLIIGQRSITDARKLIVNVVIAAILINFSMFATRLVIDASNLVALVFYKAVAPGVFATGADTMNSGISNSITNVLGISTLWKEVGTLSNTKIITVGIFGSIVLLISAFVFVAIGLILLIRYVILVFVIIFSPIAVMADVLPEGRKYFKKWKDALFNNAFFPAIFFLVMWVALTILNSLKAVINQADGTLAGALGTQGTDGGITFTPDNIGLIVNFIIVIIFIVASLLISKSMASKAGYGVDKIVGRATGWAGAGTFGMAGRLGRGTIGRAGGALTNNEKIKNTAVNGNFIESRMARLALAAGNKTAKQSFDARATGVGKQTGSGTAQKGGFTADVKAKVKTETERAKGIKPSDSYIKNLDEQINNKKIAEEAHTNKRKEVAVKYEEEHPRPNEDELNRDRATLANIQTEYDEAQNKINEAKENPSMHQLEEIEELEKDFEEKKNRLESARKAVETHEAVHKEGVDRYDREKEMAVSQGAILEADMKREAAEKAAKAAKEKEVAQGRMNKFADSLDNKPGVNIGRVGFVFKVKRENKEAAAAIRKEVKGKTKKEKAEEAAREYMEEIEKEKKEAETKTDQTKETKPEEAKGPEDKKSA